MTASFGSGDVGRVAAARLSDSGLDLGGELRALRQNRRMARAEGCASVAQWRPRRRRRETRSAATW